MNATAQQIAPASTAALRDVMIDIETLGTTPGSVILTIGAVMFGPSGLGGTFYAPVLRQSCVDVGLTIDPATAAWRDEQSAEARAAAFRDDAAPLACVLADLAFWLAAQGADRPWCHGAGFDVPLLDAAYKACGLPSPWKFWNVRDTRTLYDLAGVKPDRSQGTHHNALDDAINQTSAAVDAHRKLGIWGTSWNDAAAKLPDDDTLVLIVLNDDEVWSGYRDGNTWRYVDAMPIIGERVTHWMPMPAAPGAPA